MVVVVFVHHSFRFVGVANKLTKNSKTGDFGIIGDTDTADVVASSCDFTSAACTVSILIQNRGRFGVVVVKIPRAGGKIVGLEIIAMHIKTVVNHGHSNVLSSNAIQPEASDIDIVANLSGVQ
jgi:hypothetical protein